MDNRVLERENVRVSHEDYVAAMFRAYQAAGPDYDALRYLLKRWSPASTPPEPSAAGAVEQLQEALRNHIRWECRVRRTYCPPSIFSKENQ